MNTADHWFQGKSVVGALFIGRYECIYLHSFGTGALFVLPLKTYVVVDKICDRLSGFSF